MILASTLLGALLLAPLQPPQQGPPPPPRSGVDEVDGVPLVGEPDADGWSMVDRVEVIVNEDIITRSRLLRDLATVQRAGRINTERDLQMWQMTILRDRIRQKLQVQAGKALGLDPAILDRQIENILERQIETAGGTVALAERFEQRNSDSLETQELWKEELLSTTWSRVVTGELPGASGRPNQDRFIRPGMRKFVYQTLLETPEQFGLFGGTAPEVVFQELLVDHQSAGGIEGARELAEELRELALTGQSFTELIEEYSAIKQDEGRTRVPEAAIRPVDPELADFVAEAQPGDISAVYAARGGKVPVWAIARFEERVQAVAPDFDSLDTQLQLEERALQTFDLYRQGKALDELFQAAYVWPPELAGPEQREAPDLVVPGVE